MYPDVLTSLDRWTASTNSDQLQVAIYSSGSIFAQKLLFQHIADPSSTKELKPILDHRDIITAWFDTTNAGPKQESNSYAKIANELHKTPGGILFLSDNVNEISAAIEAGMQAVVVDRPGNAPLSEADRKGLTIVDSFEQLDLH